MAICKKCQQPFQKGDRVVSGQYGRTNHAILKWWHKTCYDGLFVDV